MHPDTLVWVRVRLLVSLFVASSCFEPGTFVCMDSAACVNEQGPGRCEANGLCSYPDASCESGRRWGAYAGSLAETCLECRGTGGGFTVAGTGDDDAKIGATLAGPGDFDGDGVADLVVGAPELDSHRGGIGLVWGADTQADVTFTADGLGGAGILLGGGAASSLTGASVSSLGDIDGDGRGDLLVGAPDFTAALNREGRAYVVFGGPDAFALNALSGENGVVVFDAAAPEGARFGHSVTSAGDVDGDGIGDIAVSSDKGASARVFVVPGAVLLSQPQIDAAVDGVTISFPGVADGERVSVAGIGDFDGDGRDDVGAAASQDEAAWILYGPIAGSATIDDVLAAGAAVRLLHPRSDLVLSRGTDVNDDGLGEFAVGARDDRQGDGAAFIVFGRTERADILLTEIGTAGGVVFHGSESENLGEAIDFGTDFDCDGVPDIVAGSPSWDPSGATTGNRQGRVHILSGRDRPESVETAALADGVRRIDSPNLTLRRFGDAVAFVGDINGDGAGDVAIGAPAQAGGGAYIIYGGS